MTELSDALSDYLKAVRTLAKAEETCQYDHGYFLRDERDAVERAEERFLNELRERLKKE